MQSTMEFRTSEIQVCWLFRHYAANVGPAVAGSAGPVPLPVMWKC